MRYRHVDNILNVIPSALKTLTKLTSTVPPFTVGGALGRFWGGWWRTSRPLAAENLHWHFAFCSALAFELTQICTRPLPDSQSCRP